MDHKEPPAFEWVRYPRWSKREVHEREMQWVRYLHNKMVSHTLSSQSPHQILQTLMLSDQEAIELSWLGFYTHVPNDQHRDLLKQHTYAKDIESYWVFLHPYGNKEFAHLSALAVKGPSMYPIQPAVFRQYEVEHVIKAYKVLSPKLVTEILNRNHAEPLESKLCYYLALVGFSILPVQEKYNIVHEIRAVFPSPEWWGMVKDLIDSGLLHVAKRAQELEKDKQLKKKQKLQNMQLLKEQQKQAALDAKRAFLNTLSIPDVRTPKFQQFMLDILFGTHQGTDPFPVYPFYINLPEGYQGHPKLQNHPKKVWDVKRLLTDSAKTNPQDGCTEQLPYLQPHQAIVNAMLQLRSLGAIQTPGLLAMHSTGAGKTLLTLCAIIAFWNVANVPKSQVSAPLRTNPPIENPAPIFVVSTKSNQQDNGLMKLAQYGMTFFKHFEDLTVPHDSPVRFPFDVTKHGKYQETLNALMEAQQQKQGATANSKTNQQPITQSSINVAKEPLFQELVATCIKHRLLRGFLSAVPQGHADKVEKLKARNRDLYTFETLGHDLKDSLFVSPIRNALFVIDEAQYINLPYKKGEATEAYDLLRRLLQSGRDPSSTWCLAMTATPGETKEQVLAILKAVATEELVRGIKNEARFIDSPKFTERIMGLVSYAQLYGDYSHFAKIEPHLYCVPMKPGATYTKLYARSLCKFQQYHDQFDASFGPCKKHKPNEKVQDDFTYDPTRKHAFFKTLRSRSNFIRIKSFQEPPKRRRGGNKKPGSNDSNDGEAESDEGLGIEDANDIDLANPDQSTPHFVSGDEGRYNYIYTYYISPKLQAVLDNIVSNPDGKHFVYATDKETIGVLAHLLVTKGFRASLPEKKDSQTGKWMFKDKIKSSDDMTPGPWFILLDNITSMKTHLKGVSYRRGNLFFNGKEFSLRKEANKARANEAANSLGQDVRVILATGENFKGVDFNHLKYLHLIDAMADYQDFIQFIGRGSRYCSHRLWELMSDRKVKIFLYHLVAPSIDTNLMADPSVWESSKARYKEQWGDIEKKLQEASVDYLVFRDTIHENTRAIQSALQNVVCEHPTEAKAITKTAKMKDKKAAQPKRHTRRYVVNKQRMREKARKQRERLGLPLQPV